MEFSLVLLNKLISMSLMAVVGYVMVKVGTLKQEDSRVISLLLLFVIQPCMILRSLQIELTPDRLQGFLFATVASSLSMLFCILFAKLFQKVWDLDPVDRTSLTYANVGNLILPLISMSLGDEMVFYGIDSDNVSPRYISGILSELSKYGKITIRRMYGDWSQDRLHSWMRCSSRFSLTPVMQPNNTPGKNCRRLADDRKIPARADRDLVTHDAVAEVLDKVLLEAQAVEFLVLAPLLQLDDQIDILAVADTGDAKQSLYVNNADTPQFDQMLRDLGRGADQRVLAHLADLDHVVGHQPVASLDQFQGHLGFTDSALARDQDADAVDVDQHAVDRDAGRQPNIQPADDLAHEIGCGVLGHQERNAVFQGVFHEEFIGLQLSAEYDARNIHGKESLIDLVFPLRTHLLHIGMLNQTDDLDPPRRKVLEISRHLHSRPVDIGLPDLDLCNIDLRCQIYEVHLRDHLI